MANNNKVYTICNSTMKDEMMNFMESYLCNAENMEVQRVDMEDTNISLLQARVRGGGIRQFVGMDKAVTIRFTETGSLLTVDVGEAKWTDKAAVMTISMFVLWPLTVTSGVGIYKQKRLISNILKQLDVYYEVLKAA